MDSICGLIQIKGAIDFHHLFKALSELLFVVHNSYLCFENLSDFADVFKLIEEFLVMATTLGARSGSYK